MRVMKFGSADRISQLPDAVLGHILSYLPMKESVQTSVLSKRWKDACMHAPVIVIDDSSLPEPEVGTYRAVHTSFINFVNNVFNLNKADSIHKFVLDCRLFDAFRVNDLVLGALRHRVRELDLCIANLDQFELGSRFAYQELVVLKLGQQFVLNVPNGVCFPSLEELHLSFVEFSDDNTIPNLVSNCPVLEHLSIYKCGMQNVEILDINAPALKILRIDTVTLDDDDEYMSETCEFKVVVDAPNLKYLEINGNLAEGYCFKNLHSLVEADIDVDVENVVESKDSVFDACILDLVKGIANAKILRLSGYTLEAIHWVKVLGLPVFHNVTKLELGGNYDCGLLLPFLLQNSPNLEVLVIDEGIALKGDLNHFEWIPPLEVPQCLSLHLKVVKIWGYQGQDAVCKFAKYVLSNGKVLNEFSADGTIQESMEKVEVSKKLLEGL